MTKPNYRQLLIQEKEKRLKDINAVFKFYNRMADFSAESADALLVLKAKLDIEISRLKEGNDE